MYHHNPDDLLPTYGRGEWEFLTTELRLCRRNQQIYGVGEVKTQARLLELIAYYTNKWQKLFLFTRGQF